MFRKLRIQFVAIVMVSVAIVLGIVFAGICLVEHQRAVSDVNEALSSAIDRAKDHAQNSPMGFEDLGVMDGNSSTFWLMPRNGSSTQDGSQSTSDDSDAVVRKEPEEHLNGPRIGGPDGDEDRSAVPVAVYALYDGYTQLKVVSRFSSASIDDDVLQTAYEQLDEAVDGTGTLGELGLHYQKSTSSDATYYAFADTSNTSSWQSLALMLGIAGLGILAAFFFIALALSKWALKPVKEAWDSQRQFVADASHDLKTPLTVILANASILLKHPDHTIAAESQWIESTQIEAQQMQGLVNEMLELAQVEAGQTTASAPFDRVDLSDLVDGETLMFDSVALERGCDFDCTIECGLTVHGNAQQLHKMVSTLVENAFKYVDEGGSIRVTLARTGKNAQVMVSNTGSLISPEDLSHIFDRFYRTDKARTSGTGGFGLGLAIAREIAHAHGGDITCTSTHADGTTFTVTLPLA